MPTYIPVPKVDQEVVNKQKEIFTSIWPTLNHQAKLKFPQFSREKAPVSVVSNHQSAVQHSEHLANFISAELAHEAIAGPFKDHPFTPWTRISPLMTRPKRESLSRRVIVDLSFPTGEAVNDGINIMSVYGCDTTYTLPSIADLVTCVQQLSTTAWIWKADLARAYRQLRVDPVDTQLLGFKVDGNTYVDLCPSFGCKSSSGCQRVSAGIGRSCLPHVPQKFQSPSVSQ